MHIKRCAPEIPSNTIISSHLALHLVKYSTVFRQRESTFRHVKTCPFLGQRTRCKYDNVFMDCILLSGYTPPSQHNQETINIFSKAKLLFMYKKHDTLYIYRTASVFKSGLYLLEREKNKCQHSQWAWCQKGIARKDNDSKIGLLWSHNERQWQPTHSTDCRRHGWRKKEKR